MAFGKSLVFAAIMLGGASVSASAQYYYPPGPGYPYPPAPPYQAQYQAPRTPPSWSYDPYTSGQAPCTQGINGDGQTCAQKMPPTYGQPSYWSTR